MHKQCERPMYIESTIMLFIFLAAARAANKSRNYFSSFFSLRFLFKGSPKSAMSVQFAFNKDHEHMLRLRVRCSVFFFVRIHFTLRESY